MTTFRRRIAIVLACVAVVIVAWRLFGGARETSPGVWDRASLPDRLQVCGRSYRHDTLDRVRTAAEVEDWQGFPPTIVQPLQVQPCIPGPCTDVAEPTPCDTVVWVRVGPDAYVDYSLQGGP
jgi:hypothetical protein